MPNLFSGLTVWQTQNMMFNKTAANNGSDYTDSLSPAMNTTINILMIIVMFLTMVSMGCTMEVSKIKQHLLKPKGVAIAALAQFGVMPLTSFSLAKAFQLTEMSVVVVLLCGCSPGGSLSNLQSLALQGDMNLSIVMTTCSTLLALVMMPLMLYIYCHGFTLRNTMPYADIIVSLVLILIPCGGGVLVNYYRPQYAKTIKRVGLVLLVITMVTIAVISSIAVEGSILAVLSPPLVAIAALMPFIGYTFGYIISWLFRLNQSERRTVSMETGCQNIHLCATILKLAFPPEVMGPLFLFPMVFVFFQLMEALVLIVLFRCHQRFPLKKKVGEADTRCLKG